MDMNEKHVKKQMKTNKITYGNQWKSLKTVQTINSLGFANILPGFP